MGEIRRLLALDATLVGALVTGYITTAVYEVTRVETPELTRFELRLGNSIGR